MKKILIAQDLQPLAITAMNFLHRADISVMTATTNDELLQVHVRENVNLIVTKLDMPGLATETLFHIIRRGESMRNVSIILLCDGTAGQQERSRQCAANAVMTLPVDPALFSDKVQQFLDVAARRSYRVVLNVAVDGKRNNRPFLCSMENVGAHGMLIRTAENLAPNDQIACSFYLPDGTRVSASGVVVRVVGRSPDGGTYGIRFVTVAADAEAALLSFVNRELHRRPAADPLESASPA